MAGCVTVARLDVWRHQLPEELKGVQLTSLPLLLTCYPPGGRSHPSLHVLFHRRCIYVHTSPSRLSLAPLTPREGPVRYRTLEL